MQVSGNCSQISLHLLYGAENTVFPNKDYYGPKEFGKMENVVFLEAFSSNEDNQESFSVKVPLEAFITYCIYKFCCPEKVSLQLVRVPNISEKKEVTLCCEDSLHFTDTSNIPWQISSCVFPVVFYGDTVITGLCAVARHICKYRSLPSSPVEHEEGLLGFRKSCLQAPNETSIWTKFCEVDIMNTVTKVLSSNSEAVKELPINLVRFENHLNKPVKVHNVYKVARDLKKESTRKISNDKNELDENQMEAKTRVAKTRKWKSNVRKQHEVDCSAKIEDLDISHQFAEGPFLTLADLILMPSYYILIKLYGESVFKSLLPSTYKWFCNIIQISELEGLLSLMKEFKIKPLLIGDIVMPAIEDVSLYKSDPKRHNPKKRLFTKEGDIENALSTLLDGMELNVTSNPVESTINWDTIPDGANPLAGHLPDERMVRKSEQLENLALAVLNVAKEEDLIVDFCSGSGHLGILVAHLLPKCTVILLENKEQSLLRARTRVHDMDLQNVFFFQCNLDFFTGKFDIGLALHACGIATDLVLDKCLKANAKFVLCPCCYGSLHATDRLVYPRSSKFSEVSIDQYLCIGHAADQTHKEHPLTVRGAKCMAVIDSDRARLAEESGYTVTLSRLKPLSCTPKNNLLIGLPSLK